MRHIKATAYLPNGELIVLDLICAGHSAAAQIVEALHPNALRISIIQRKGAS